MKQQAMHKINLIIGKVIQEHYFLKIVSMIKINKHNKHMIIVKEKWINEDRSRDNKK